MNHTQSNLFVHVTAPQVLTERPFALTAVDAAVLPHMSLHISGNRLTERTSDLKVRSVIMSGG